MANKIRCREAAIVHVISFHSPYTYIAVEPFVHLRSSIYKLYVVSLYTNTKSLHNFYHIQYCKSARRRFYIRYPGSNWDSEGLSRTRADLLGPADTLELSLRCAETGGKLEMSKDWMR